jgi:hypothetical protein
MITLRLMKALVLLSLLRVVVYAVTDACAQPQSQSHVTKKKEVPLIFV